MTGRVQPFQKICEQCGQPWMTRWPASRTCSPKCRAQLREIETPTPGKPRDYPQEVVDRVRSLYAEGATIAEIADALGPGYKADLLVRRYVNERRPAAPRPHLHRAEHSPSWKGSDAGYQALHLRVEAARGKPDSCACCDTKDPDKRYEWANLSGRYDDITDYARLCITCHRRLDAARRASTGQRTSLPRGGGSHV